MNVGVMALARECGVSSSTISKRMQRGQSPDDIRRTYGIEPKKRIGRPPGSPGNRKERPAHRPSEYDMILEGRSRADELQKWKLRHQRALTERQEIETMLRRGELMPIAYARKWGIRFLMDGRDELLKGPGELADSLAAENDPLKVAAILRGWLERAIAKFEQLEMLWKGEVTENEQVA